MCRLCDFFFSFLYETINEAKDSVKNNVPLTMRQSQTSKRFTIIEMHFLLNNAESRVKYDAVEIEIAIRTNISC